MLNSRRFSSGWRTVPAPVPMHATRHALIPRRSKCLMSTTHSSADDLLCCALSCRWYLISWGSRRLLRLLRAVGEFAPVLLSNADPAASPYAVRSSSQLIEAIGAGQVRRLLGGSPEGVVLKHPGYVTRQGLRPRYEAEPGRFGVSREPGAAAPARRGLSVGERRGRRPPTAQAGERSPFSQQAHIPLCYNCFKVPSERSFRQFRRMRFFARGQLDYDLLDAVRVSGW